MKKLVFAFVLFSPCLALCTQLEKYKIYILDDIIFQNNTQFDIEDLQAVVQDPRAYTSSNFLFKIKIPPMKTVTYPAITEKQKKIASKIAWQFNEEMLPQVGTTREAILFGFDYAATVLKNTVQENLLSAGVRTELNILQLTPVWCIGKDKKKKKCKDPFIIQRDISQPYKFLISEPRKQDNGKAKQEGERD